MEQRGDSIKLIRRDTEHLQRLYSFVKRHRMRYVSKQVVMKADLIPELLSLCESEIMLDVDILFTGLYVNHALALDEDKRIINAILDEYPDDLDELDAYLERVKISKYQWKKTYGNQYVRINNIADFANNSKPRKGEPS